MINVEDTNHYSEEKITKLTQIEDVYLKTSFDKPVASKATVSKKSSCSSISGARKSSCSGTCGASASSTSCLNSVQRKLFSLLVEDTKCLTSVSESDVSKT